jgi:molybdopterin biosynthesis enzyme
MRGFAKRQTVAEALYWLDSQVRPLPMEVIPLHTAAGRVLAKGLVSRIDVPGFHRAMRDGYAVAAESTDGAASYTPVPLTVIGESMPGNAFRRDSRIGTGCSHHDRRSHAGWQRLRLARDVQTNPAFTT